MSEWNNSAPTGGNFLEFHIPILCENLPRKFKFYYNRLRIKRTLQTNQYTFLIISRSVLLRMRNIAGKFVEEIKTLILCSNFFFFFSKIVSFMRKFGKNIVQPVRPQMTILRMRIACWIPKATNMHSEYVIFNAFAQPQWLPERASCYVLRTLQPVFL